MNGKTMYMFRVFYLIGLIMLFLSLFMEWYSFQMRDFGNMLVVSWSYYLFSSWQTPFLPNATLNSVMKPEGMFIPYTVNIILIIAILAAGYVVLFKNVDYAKNIRVYNKYAYINIFLLLLIGYYVIVCPLLYLTPNGLYFPFLSINNYDAEYMYMYSVGIGYIFQLISFPLVFPYSVFYYKTANSYIQQERAPEKLLEKTIQASQEVIDLDKYIAEEQFHYEKVVSLPDKEEKLNAILTTFMEGI
ncbi:MAG: hypothetical protein ACFFDF_14555 [Candidatus Odinarchaeota archaeon]